MRKSYELCGADREVLFSPYSWRARFCLRHKGLEFEGVPLHFLEKDTLIEAPAKTYPTLFDNGTWVSDSFEIARYLEDTYPEKPLFGSAIAMGQARLLNDWINRTVILGIFPMIVADLHGFQDAENAAYFRTSREARFGKSLEETQSARDGQVDAFRKSLAPLRATLRAQPYFSGDSPAWADYAVAGSFMWPHVASPYQLLEADDPIADWFGGMLDLFGGEGRKAKRAYQGGI